ncbi:MAG: PHP domain-containing protein [Gammaproteobacteria bacterium]
MPLNYDLHCHSTASDGTLEPEELVRHARSKGVDVLALTDHDTTAGVAQASAAARACGVLLVPGVEISVTWNRRTVHIVGVNVDPADEPLQRGLAGLRAFRRWRAQEIARRLDKAGIPGAEEGARRYAGGAIVGRTHFARFLVGAGHARQLRDVFKRFLVKDKPGYVPGQWASLADAVAWIRGAGGMAVIAHPARYGLTATKLRGLLGEFRDTGGEGLEVVTGSHSPQEILAMAGYAKGFGLLASCGSDYHGPEDPWIEMGRLPALPETCTPVWAGDRWLHRDAGAWRVRA